MSAKILVTGGAGFIGSHTVVELANAGFEPVIVDNFSNSDKVVIDGLSHILNKKIKYYEEDCCNYEILERIFNTENFSGVIHFAAFKAVSESVEVPLKYYENNLLSLIVLIKAMKKFQVDNLVFSSSCTVYGQPDNLPVTEDAPFKQAFSPYGYTKQICENILKDEYKAGALKTIALRYFNPIGAHHTGEIGELPLGYPNNLVPYLTQSVAGLRDKLTIFGKDYNTPDGTCIRDYIHVVDLAKAHVSALHHLQELKESVHFDAINVGTGKGSSVLDLINTFENTTGKKVPYQFGDRRPGDAESIYAESSKALEVLNWKTSLSLEDALRDAWNWQEKLLKRTK